MGIGHGAGAVSSALQAAVRLAIGALAVFGLAFPAWAEPVRIGGTGVGSALFQRLVEEYRRSFPGAEVTVVMPPLGSNGSLRALKAGKLDIALIGRKATPEELSQARFEEFAHTPVVFAVFGDRVPRLSLAELSDIYAGRQTHWPDGTAIRLVLRARNESDMLILRGMSPGLNEAIDASYARKGMLYGDNDLDTFDIIERTRGAIGPTTVGLARLEGRNVGLVALEGIEPNDKTIASSGYPWMKPILIGTGDSPSGATRDFLAFVRSEKVRRLAARMGFFPPAP